MAIASLAPRPIRRGGEDLDGRARRRVAHEGRRGDVGDPVGVGDAGVALGTEFAVQGGDGDGYSGTGHGKPLAVADDQDADGIGAALGVGVRAGYREDLSAV